MNTNTLRKRSKKALRKMNTRAQGTGLFILSAMALVIFLALGIIIFVFAPFRENALTLGLLIVLGVGVLIVLLFIMASAFKTLHLTDPKEALGLPSGSIRAMIALLLIVIWAIVSIFVIRLFALPLTDIKGNQLPLNAEALKVAQQLFTTMSTLVVAIAAFYFGSSSVRAAHATLAPAEQPVITDIFPGSGYQGQRDMHLTILGKNVGSPRSVRLVRDQEEINAESLTYRQTDIAIIGCTISIAAARTTGKWDVIVVNYDGSEVKLEKGFEVTNPPPPTATSTPEALASEPVPA